MVRRPVESPGLQAYLYEALVVSPRHGVGDAEAVMGRPDLRRLDWRSDTDPTDRAEVEQAVRVAADYVRRRDEPWAPRKPTALARVEE